MDKHFMSIAVVGVIIIGVAGLVVGALCSNTPVAVAGIGLASTGIGILGGLLAAPKVPGATATVPPPDAVLEAEVKN